ncbi:MAG TPA: ABC transporter permease [Bacteroidales bacterium]
MQKIFLIIKREYITRVKKRSFIVMTILGPLLMAALFIVPIYLATRTDEEKVVDVVDETGWFIHKFENNDNYKFVPLYTDLEKAKETLKNSKDHALLYIPLTQVTVPSSAIIYSDHQPSINLKNYITEVMTREIENQKLAAEIKKELQRRNPGYKGNESEETLISETILKNIKSTINLTTIKIEEGGKEAKSYTELSMAVGLIGSMMIYFFIFLFGAQVMRGVIEEKTSRIIEVIVSSVKPFQLMMGKILGIALVGLTQFLLWVIFTAAIVTAVQSAFPDKFKQNPTEQSFAPGSKMMPSTQTIQKDQATTAENPSNEIFDAINSINYIEMIGAFIFFFIGGYLLYAALFAAIGSAVDSEADTQQFMLPITIPLIFSIVMAQYVINNPDGPLSFWLSIIPLTSPVIMMIRIPFGVPVGELALSAGLLIAGFLGTTWLAARIYRTGILMYGKKVSYREIVKWLFY